MPILAYKLLIEGRVQGVGYRAATQAQALAFNLQGWVRNTSGGAVEAFVQGPPEEVEKLIEWCRKGPPSSRVDQVTATPEAVQNHRAFLIVK